MDTNNKAVLGATVIGTIGVALGAASLYLRSGNAAPELLKSKRYFRNNMMRHRSLDRIILSSCQSDIGQITLQANGLIQPPLLPPQFNSTVL